MQPARSQVGHEEPFAIQFSVFLANRVGKLRDLLVSMDKVGFQICQATACPSLLNHNTRNCANSHDVWAPYCV